ncbi:MAG: FAD-dependent oxidoreductase [Defluviitaleaceae bacterium]|nr:FAD-dependent oxidoreductase [Defluviitaleaceae bacterium]
MKNLYDLIIIGAGAAGLSAAIYAGRAKLKTLVIEKSDPGGQIKITNEVVNYPGVVSTTGTKLAGDMKKQAENFGVNFITADVTKVDFSREIKTVTAGDKYSAVGVIIATGAKPRKLGFEGEAQFAGRGIAYCATCDGEFFTGKDVYVIGAGFAAAEEAIFLTRFAKKVTIIAREPEFTCSKTIADKVMTHDKIEVNFNSEIMYVRGENLVNEAKFVNNQTGETWVHQAKEGSFGVFVFVGYEPESAVFKGHVTMDNWGYIPASEDMETNISGIYAAGDIRPKRLRQLVTAAADGAIASTAAEKYIDEVKAKLGLIIEPIDSKEVKEDTHIFNDQSATQIKIVMERLERPISIHAILQPDCELSSKIKDFLQDFKSIAHKIPIHLHERGHNQGIEAKIQSSMFPIIALMDENQSYTGIGFNGVPAGHELESFILAIYNIAGPGQPIHSDLLYKIQALSNHTNIKIGVSLSCTMCPEIVQASQRIAAINNNVSAEMIDIQFFSEFRQKHGIMSVPALVLNDKDVIFGKKSLEELVGHLL